MLWKGKKASANLANRNVRSLILNPKDTANSSEQNSTLRESDVEKPLIVHEAALINTSNKIESNARGTPGTTSSSKEPNMVAVHTSNTNHFLRSSDVRSHLTPAGFGKRLMAAITDHVLVLGTAYTFSFLGLVPLYHYLLTGHCLSPLPLHQNGSEMNSSAWFAVAGWFALVFAVAWLPVLYFSCFEHSRFRATPGKRLFGLTVTSKNSNTIAFSAIMVKVILQQLCLYLFAIVSLITVSPLAGFNHLLWSILVVIIFVCLSALSCLPICSDRSQSLLDKLAGRFVVESSSFSEQRWKAALGSNLNPRDDRHSSKLQGLLRVIRACLAISFNVLLIVATCLYAMCGQPAEAVTCAGLTVTLIAATIAWWKTPCEWRSRLLLTGAGAVITATVIAALTYLIPYDFTLVTKTVTAAPIAEKAFSLDPTGKSDRSSQLLKQAKSSFSDLWMPYYLGSTYALYLGMPETARELARKGTILSNNSPTMLLSEAGISAKSGMRKQALNLCEQVLATTYPSKRKSDTTCRIGAVKLLLGLGKLDRAEQFLTAMITADATNPELYDLRAQAYEGMGKLQLARRDIEMKKQQRERHVSGLNKGSGQN